MTVITLSEKITTNKNPKGQKIENLGRIFNQIYHVHHISNPTRGYSNTDAATTSKGKVRNSISRNHKNRSRRNNQLGNISLDNFIGEVPSVGAIPGTVA